MLPLGRFVRILLVLLALSAEVALAGTRVLFLGDSLTEGYGVAKSASYPALIDAELKKTGRTDVTIVNAGISGSTTASGVSRLRWQLKGKEKPQIMVLALGANDGLRGLDLAAARKNLKDVIELAKTSGVRVLLAGMKIPPNYGKAYTADFEKMFPELAKAEGVELIPFLLDGVAADPKLNGPDGIHPNEKGHEIVAKTVMKYLAPMLQPPS
jgi:acyl-CoA thioesterase-1